MSARPAPLVPVLAVVGTGLIGGSFAAALRRVGQVGRVLGVGRSQASLDAALQRGLIDEAVGLPQAAARADLILLATPVGAMRAALEGLRPHLRPDTLVTDAGSTKSDVACIAREVLGEQRTQFVPGHPIAGSDQAGPQAADALLYHGRQVVLTPFDDTPEAAQRRVATVWEACGARVVHMTPQAHDEALAAVSHVPHLLAAAYVLGVVHGVDADRRLGLAGTGFRDFTRIAAGSAEVWRDIFRSNRAAVQRELDAFDGALQSVRRALDAPDEGALLEALLDEASRTRRYWGGPAPHGAP